MWVHYGLLLSAPARIWKGQGASGDGGVGVGGGDPLPLGGLGDLPQENFEK